MTIGAWITTGLLGAVLGAGVLGCGPRYEMRPPPDAPLDTHATPEAPPPPLTPSPGTPTDSKVDQVGQASWYGGTFAGRKTASGERFDPTLYTAAHRRLPFGTWVEVRRVDTGRTVRVRINDRGPKVASRIIDLSRRAAEDLDLVRTGVATVELRVVSGP